MGWMDDFKRRMEHFSKEVQKATGSKGSSGGQVLGGNAGGENLTAVFSSPTLGLTVNTGAGNGAVVNTVEAGSPAAKAGVLPGDVIVRVAETPVVSYTDFLTAFRGSGRPVEIGFVRPALTRGAARSSSEREARREAQAKAALERDGAWAKRVATRPQGGRLQHPKAAPSAEYKKSTNPETIAAWKAAEERADATVKELGYDPFKSLSTGNAAPLPSSMPAPADGAGRRLGDGSADEAEAYDRAAAAARIVVEDLASHADHSQRATCIATLLKILDNAYSKDDEKFRRVRLANPTLRSKVLSIPGGLEALCAAGFELTSDPANPEDTILQLPADYDRPTIRAVIDAITVVQRQIDDAAPAV